MINDKNKSLYEQNLIDDTHFDFDDYFQYEYSNYFKKNVFKLHNIKPFLFFSNDNTWKTALLLYELIFQHQLEVITYCSNKDYIIINYQPENVNKEKYNDIMQSDLTEYLIKIADEHKLDFYDSKINYSYIAKHIMKSL